MAGSTAHASPDFDDVCRFIVSLGEAAHGYGSASTRLEAYLRRLTRAFGYTGVFRSTPNEIIFAIQKTPNAVQPVHVSTFSGTGWISPSWHWSAS